MRARLALRSIVCIIAVWTAALFGYVPGLALAAGPSPPPTPVGRSHSPSPFPTVLHTPAPGDEPPRLRSDEALLEDLDTGQVLFGQRPSTPRPIASLTKIMTALLVLERSPLTGEVTVSRNAATTPPSDLGLKAGERISVRDLLYGLLLGSANDAAVALAEHVGSSIGGFVTMMNARARQLGMRHTRFRSPNGLDDRGYSTALDLATLTRAVYQHRAFESIVAAKFHTIPGPGTKVRRVQNRNALLWLYPGAIGVKTGFTTPAGHCLVAVSRSSGPSWSGRGRASARSTSEGGSFPPWQAKAWWPWSGGKIFPSCAGAWSWERSSGPRSRRARSWGHSPWWTAIGWSGRCPFWLPGPWGPPDSWRCHRRT